VQKKEGVRESKQEKKGFNKDRREEKINPEGERGKKKGGPW
jgi:hypothetical protein